MLYMDACMINVCNINIICVARPHLSIFVPHHLQKWRGVVWLCETNACMQMYANLHGCMHACIRHRYIPLYMSYTCKDELKLYKKHLCRPRIAKLLSSFVQNLLFLLPQFTAVN